MAATERLKKSGTTPFERLTKPLGAFARLETSGGILLVACTVAALVWANSPWSSSYFNLWQTHLAFGFGRAQISKELSYWINDGLMALFFLLVGLEIKRESLAGELASWQKAALPIVAALGGMLVPAGLYSLLNHHGPGVAGWGIPMATDIAFALGVLALLGNRVPASLRVFLAALAIADDIGAVLVIAFFYTAQISWLSLAVAGIFFVGLIAMNRSGARHPLIYALLGFGLWIAFLKSGIHATVAGVLLALTIPARQRIDVHAFLARSEATLGEIRGAHEAGETVEGIAAKGHGIERLVSDCERVESPMLRFEHALAPWIKHVVMPVFALANAGVLLNGGAASALFHPIGLGVICGLVIGKPLGIVVFSWLGTRSGIATMPTGARWRQILGVSALGGIGFTMSLFIADLAFDSTPMLEAAKVAILFASVVSGVAGILILWKGPAVRGSISEARAEDTRGDSHTTNQLFYPRAFRQQPGLARL
jgi:Na+:H+ antiporter, NhaA family